MKNNRGRFIAMKRVSRGGGLLSSLYFDGLKKRYTRERNRVHLWGDIIRQRLIQNSGLKMGMITLTYDALGTKVKAARWSPNDVRAFMRTLRGRMKKRLKAYAWVAELQANGNVHYHVLIVYTGRIEYPDKTVFYGGKTYKRIWNYGMSNVKVRVRTSFYILRYVGKEYQKDFDKFPPGARAFAVWVADKNDAVDMRYASLSLFEKSLVDEFGWVELTRTIRKDGQIVKVGNYEGWRKTRRDLLFDSEFGAFYYVGTFATEDFAQWTLDNLPIEAQ
jgi:hypothetical protein